MSKPTALSALIPVALTTLVASALVFVPVDASAQRAPAQAPAATTPARGGAPAVPGVGPADACSLDTESGLRLAFASCGGTVQGDATRTVGEVEVIEYRNGDQRARTELRIDGIVHRDVALRTVRAGYGDAGVARAGTGPVWEARIVLHGSGPEGTRVLQGMWDTRAREGTTYPIVNWPVEVGIRDESGAVTTIALDRCAPAEWAEATSALVVSCDTARPVGALEGNPYALFVAQAGAPVSGGQARPVTLMDSRSSEGGAPAATSAATVRGGERATPALAPARGASDGRATGMRRFRLQGATLQSWSIDFDPPGGATAVPMRWTLEVRVARVEMA